MDKVDGEIPEAFRPTAHMFYGTRQFDVDDKLGKWEVRSTVLTSFYQY